MLHKYTIIPLMTIIRKELFRFMDMWTQTLIPPVITTVLYFLIFGKFIGSQIQDINGFSYIQFIVPGLIMMTMITNSFSNVVSSFFGDKFQRCIDELLVSPTPNYIILLGFSIGGILRGLIVGFLVTLISLLFVPLYVYNIFIIILFMVLTTLVFSLAGFTNGIFAKKFDDVSIFPTFILTPLTYLGGVFYSINSLPPFWQKLSTLNPIVYMVNGFRYGFLGFSDINVWFGVAMLVIFAIILWIINLILLRKGIGLKN